MKRSVFAIALTAILLIGPLAHAESGPATSTAQSATSTSASDAATSTPQLLQSLYAQLQSLEEQIGALEIASSSAATSSASETATSPPASGDSCAPLFLARSLSVGSTGNDVSQLQAFLQSEGYYTYPSITGYFGPVTKQAVATFQSANSIDAIGIIGPITRAKISALSAACQTGTNTSQTTSASSVGTTTPALATTTAATSTSTVPISQPIATGNTPGFGGGGGAPASTPAPAAPPDWILSGAATDLDFADQQYYGGTLDSLISTSRASPETCNWSDGSVTYAATDTPCITDLGLAVWQGSTNLVEDSGDLSGSAWSNYTTGSGTVSVTGDAGTAPDGTQTAALVTVSVSTSTPYNQTDDAVRMQSFVPPSPSASYSYSIWLKAATPSDVGKVIVLRIFGGYTTRVILTSNWVRYSVLNEALPSSDVNLSQLQVGYYAARDIPQNGPVSFYAWGAQAELGSAPTAYIPTTSSTVSRAPDVITAAGALQNTLAAATGSLSVRTTGSEPATTGTLIDSDGNILLGKTDGDALTDNLLAPLTNDTPMSWVGPAASSIAWNATGRSLALNAGTAATDGQAMAPSAPFYLGSTEGSSSFFNGYITRLTAWPTKVSDATLAAMPSAGNTTYYVAASGNDNNNGTSPSTPWQSVAKVNAGTYYPGDKILFNGGDTFTGCLRFYNTNTFGTSSDPIVVGSYGTGRFTLDANCPYYKSEGVYLEGVGGFTLENAILEGNGSGTWYGVRIENFTSQVVNDITVQDSDISGFYETDGGTDSSEIEIDGFPGAGLNDVNILNNTLHGNSGPTSPDQNGVKGYAGVIDQDLSGTINMTNFVFQGNTVYDVGDGILANEVNGALIQYNIAHDIGANSTGCGGPVGIWANGSNNVTIQYNEVYRVEPSTYTTGCDWDGFDLDNSVTNSTMQYNYSHDNWGAGYLLWIPGGSNNTVRYNIAENNATTTAASAFGGITISNGNESGFNIYNNTVFSDGPANTSLFTITYGNPASTTIANNVFYSTDGANLIYTVDSSNPGSVTLVNNDYYAAGPFKISWGGQTYTSLTAFQASTTEDTMSTTTNPWLAGTPPAGICNTSSNGSTTPQPCPSIYALQASSTLIGAGLDLTKSPYGFSVGSQDYFGNAISHGTGTGFNIGAYGGTQ